jgi:phage-related holin
MEFADVSSVFESIAEFFVWLWGLWYVKVLVLHVIVNVIVAVMAGIRTEKFVLAKLWEFLYRKVLPLVGTFAVFTAFGESINQPAIAPVVWILIETMLVSDLLDNLKKMGVPIPNGLTKVRLL